MPVPLLPTTELEAINYILATIAEAPLESIGDATFGDAVMVRNTFQHKNRQIQSLGWHWNTDHKFPLSFDANGEIHVPANTLHVDVDLQANPDLDLVNRGSRLYDRKGHTYNIGKDVKVTLVTMLPFTDLPQVARDFIVISSARAVQGQIVGSRLLDSLTADDEQLAWTSLWQQELESSDVNMLKDNPSVKAHRMLRYY